MTTGQEVIVDDRAHTIRVEIGLTEVRRRRCHGCGKERTCLKESIDKMEGIYTGDGVRINSKSALGKKILQEYKKTLRVLCRECIDSQQIEDLIDLDWDDIQLISMYQ